MATVEKLENSRVRLTMEISPEEFEKGMQKSYAKNAKYFNVPGFRKGKAPRKVVETTYGESMLYDDAVEFCFPDAFTAVCEENDIHTVDSPSLTDIEQIGSGLPLIIKVEVDVEPTVTLGAYKGIEVKKLEYNVTDETVEAEIDRKREELARYISVERPIANGDTVTFDYSGSVDGVKFEGGTAEQQELEIGSGMFIPGFEEQMVGLNIGDEKELNVKFPDEYHSSELAGKNAVFAVKIHDIRTKELPAADDEFAKDVSEFETIADYRADIRASLEKDAKAHAEADMHNEALGKIVENATLDIPECYVTRELDRLMQEFESTLSKNGLNLELFCKYYGMTEEGIREERRKQAEADAKLNVVMAEIIKAENITFTDDEKKTIAHDFAIANNFEDADKFVEGLSEQILGYIAEQEAFNRAMKLITESVVPVEVKAEEEK